MTGKAKRQIILVSWGNTLITLSEEICSGHYVCHNSTICAPSPTMSSIGPLEPSSIGPLEPSLSPTPPVDLVEVRASGGCGCHLVPRLAFLPVATCSSACSPCWIPLPKSNQLRQARSRWRIHRQAPTAHPKCRAFPDVFPFPCHGNTQGWAMVHTPTSTFCLSPCLSTAPSACQIGYISRKKKVLTEEYMKVKTERNPLIFLQPRKQMVWYYSKNIWIVLWVQFSLVSLIHSLHTSMAHGYVHPYPKKIELQHNLGKLLCGVLKCSTGLRDQKQNAARTPNKNHSLIGLKRRREKWMVKLWSCLTQKY